MASDDGHDGLGELSSEVEDATMEISLQDIYSIKEEDQREGLDASSSPAPADASQDELATVERPAISPQDLEPFDAGDPTPPPEPPSRFGPPRGEPTTELEFDASTYTGQGLDEELLEEDTNPSMVSPPELLDEFDDPEGLGGEPTDPTFDRPLAELEDLDDDSDAYDDLDDPGPSTSVLDPDEELLAQASWHDPALEDDDDDEVPAPDPEDATGHFEVPAALLSRLHEPEQPDEDDYEDATGHFEIPAALLSKLRERDEATSSGSPGAPQQEPMPELSDPHISVMELEAIAEVDAQGRLVLPEQIVRVGPLRPGMRVRLKIQILE